MRTNTQETVLSAYIASIGKRTPRDAAQDAAELCKLATSLNRLNEIACNSGLTERQERQKQTYKPGSRPCWKARAWSSTTSTVIREVTPCTSICPMAPTTASAGGNAATASGGETMYDRVVIINKTHWPAYRKPGTTLIDLRIFDPDDRSPSPRRVFRPEKLRELGIPSALIEAAAQSDPQGFLLFDDLPDQTQPPTGLTDQTTTESESGGA